MNEAAERNPGVERTRIRFIHQYFHPDLSSVSRVISQVAFDLAAHGAEVTALCSRNRYDDAQPEALKPRETIRGVDVVRCWGPSLGRGSLPARVADMLSFCVGGTMRALRSPRAGTNVILTNPPLYALVGSLLKSVRGERFVYVMMDVYPDVAVRSGVLREEGFVHRLMRRASRRILDAADAIVVLGEDMRQVALRAGADPGRVTVIPNWADPDEISPVAPGSNPLRAAWGLDGKFVVEYSGNLGVAHAWEEILDVAGSLSGRDDIRFLFVGGGVGMRAAEREAAARRLPNVLFRPYAEHARLGESLSAGDVHYVSLRPGFEGLVVPSKSYGIMAAGRPILYQGADSGEIAEMVRSEGVGHVVPPGDREGLREKVIALRDDPEGRLRMGAAARRVMLAKYSAGVGLRRYRELLLPGRGGTG